MMRKRQITIAGSVLTLYSMNGKDWFSQPADCAGYHWRREQERQALRNRLLALAEGEMNFDMDPGSVGLSRGWRLWK